MKQEISVLNLKLKVWVVLSLIVIFGGILRLVDINNNPRALYGDELTLVYDAYSISKTAQDQRGNFLPLVFYLGGDRPGGYVYATVPFAAVFGPTPFVTRIVSVMSGIFSIWLIFLIARILFNQKIGLLAAFFISISPWDLSLSRGGFESHFAMFLALLGVWAFLKAKLNPKWYLASALGFGLSMHTYPTYRLIIPLFVLFLFLINGYFKKPMLLLKNVWMAAFIVILSFLVLLVFYVTFNVGVKDRFSTINIFAQQDIRQNLIQKINTERSLDKSPLFGPVVFHNIVLEYMGTLGENYISNLMPDFLFLSGDGNPRHNGSVMGEFYMVDFILIIAGIVFLSKYYKKHLLMFSGWILITPIAASLVGPPHALRDSFFMPAMIILSACGMFYLWNNGFDKALKLFGKVKINSLFLGLIVFGFIIQFTIFVDRQYFTSPDLYSRFWSYPSKQASTLAINKSKDYDYVFISTQLSNAEFAYPVYADLDPNLVISQNKHPTILEGFPFRKYNNVYIGQISDDLIEKFINNLPGSVLYIGAARQQQFFSNYSTIYGTDGLVNLVVLSKGKIFNNN